MMRQNLLTTIQTRWPWMGNHLVWLASLLVFTNFAFGTIVVTYVGSVFLVVYGAGNLPYLYLIQGVMILVLSLLSSPLIIRYPRHFMVFGNIIAIGLIALGQIFIRKYVGWMPFLSCVVLWSINQVYGINVGNFLALIFNLRQFKEYNPIYTSFATLSSAAFSFTLPLIIHRIGVHHLPLIVIGLLIASLPIFQYLKIQHTMPAKVHQREKIKVTRYPLFNNLLLYLSMTVIIGTLVDYCLKFTLNVQFDGKQIASFLAIMNGAVSIVVFLLQLTVTKQLMRKIGVAGLLLILPIIAILMVTVNLFYSTLITTTLLAFTSFVSLGAMTNIAREVILNVLPTAIRLKGKTLLRGITVTVGMLMAAVVIWVVSRYFGVAGVELCLLVCAIIAAYFAWQLQKNYKNTLRDQLILKRFKPEQILSGYTDTNLLQNLVQATLKTDDPRLNFLGFSMFPMANFSALPQEIRKFIFNQDFDIRIQAIKATKIIKDASIVKLLCQRMDEIDDDNEKFYLLDAIYHQDVSIALQYANQLYDHSYPRLRACAIDIQIKQGDIKQVATAINSLRDMVEATDPSVRAGATEILGGIGVGDFTHELIALINDPIDIVALNAIRAATQLHKTDTIPALIQRLGKGIIGFAASKALQEFGKVALPALQDKVLNTTSINECTMAIKTIAYIESSEAEAILIAISNIKNLVLFHQIAKYSAYRAQKMEVSGSFLKHAEAMLNREIYNIRLLRYMHEQYKEEFYQREIMARLRLAQKGFLYWLAILNNPVELIPIVIALCANADRLNVSGFNYAIELLEASLKHSKYSLSLKQAFEDEMNNVFSEDPLSALLAIDPWLGKILSTPLTTRVGRVMDTLQIVMTLRNTNLFESLPGETLLAIAEVTKVREVTAGEVIYQQGELPGAVYIVANGECQLTKNGKTLLQLKSQDCFGLIGVFENKAWDVTATAVTDGVLLYIEKAAFDQIIDDVPEVMHAMMNVVLGYLKESIQKNLLR